MCVRVHSKSLKTVPFESLRMVSYSHSKATMAVSLTVSTQYTNVTDTQPDTQPPHDSKSRTASYAAVARKKN